MEVIPDALELAGAYCAEQTLRLLDEHSREYPEIAAVRDVFALEAINNEAAWYLTHGLLDVAAVKAVQSQRRGGLLPQAIDRLADHLPALLEAFDFDDEILGAPVLADDIPAAWDSRCHSSARRI